MHDRRPNFTADAALLWNSIPKKNRERILKNAFCPECMAVTEMVHYTGEVKDGDIILTGTCAKRGHVVSELVETSEQDHSGN
jgi:hypothetical protein